MAPKRLESKLNPKTKWMDLTIYVASLVILGLLPSYSDTLFLNMEGIEVVVGNLEVYIVSINHSGKSRKLIIVLDKLPNSKASFTLNLAKQNVSNLKEAEHRASVAHDKQRNSNAAGVPLSGASKSPDLEECFTGLKSDSLS